VGWKDRTSNFGWDWRFSYFQTHADRLWDPANEHRRHFSGIKRPELESKHSHAYIVEVENEWSYTSASPLFSWNVGGSFSRF
jgi:hypothetical protein